MNYAPFALFVALVGGGFWLSRGLGAVQVWLYGLGMLALVGMAAETCLAGKGGGGSYWERGGLSAWAAAALLVATGIWVMQVAPAEWLWPTAAATVAVSAIHLLGLSVGSDPDSRLSRYGRFASNVIVFLLVFVLFTLIYGTKLRSLVTATSVGMVALIASMDLLRFGGKQRVDRALVAMAVMSGLLIAEAAWLLNYWPVGGLVGGATLLLCYYVLVGLLQCIRDGSFGRAAALEYGAVGAVGFLAILIVVP